jgi:hypothetical protein
LGGNFAGLTAARFIREYSGDAVNITVLDRKPYLIFIPNIGIEVLANRDPSRAMHMDIVSHLNHDGSHFLEGEIVDRGFAVKRGQLLARLRAPELYAQSRQRDHRTQRPLGQPGQPGELSDEPADAQVAIGLAPASGRADARSGRLRHRAESEDYFYRSGFPG